ncbi:uncharacterized protein LOC143244812 [Tachypleus tridentatus]|uniref:uncharacterized protein LOC143244812 n=1 Tax=Tachypleus tridentatus TaxID=6853 RepID=UPI003FD2B223
MVNTIRKNSLLTLMTTLVLGIFVLPYWTQAQRCSEENTTFELITGFVYSAPEETLTVLPGTLKLNDCLVQCRKNATCQAINFETGLCVLFSSSFSEEPGTLKTSHFPVFTMYAQKICLRGATTCKRKWMFERVFDHELRQMARKRILATSRQDCMSLCLEEQGFKCRSVNYNRNSGECALNDMDRHTVVAERYYGPSDNDVEYLESNCVDEPVRLCEFRKISGRIVKTVDVVFENITTPDECRKKCLSVPYRCHSFDLSDPTNRVCRLSHHSSVSLSHIKDPYLESPGSITYELTACYKVSIYCEAKEMITRIKTNKLFNGKLYAKTRPNSCVQDVVNKVEFEIRMAYNDLDCDVKQEVFGQFSNDIVIQHHDMIVTNQDLGLSVHCHYDLTNKSVTNGKHLAVSGEVNTSDTQTVTVGSPNVTMRITDRLGSDLFSAEVGDPIGLRFEIKDRNSPYEIFVRELVAMDGIDNGEILLIDSEGCPTDDSIMSALVKVSNNEKTLQALFDAFKFPTSEIVEFKAMVTPCLPKCKPANCTMKMFNGASHIFPSLGRRKRHTTTPTKSENVVVVQRIRITDNFNFERNDRHLSKLEPSGSKHLNDRNRTRHYTTRESTSCVNIVGLIIACSLFLLAQMILILAWGYLWQKRKNNLSKDAARCYDVPFSLAHKPY